MSQSKTFRGSVIVTGGAGYIGSHTCKALAARGYVPVTYDNLSIGNRWAVRWGPLERGDILDLSRLHDVFKEHRPIGVLHFAALALVGESMQIPALYYRTNVAGAQNVLDACRIHDVPVFVFSSTCAVYGIPESTPISEQTPTLPINPYGASKLMVERILADYEMAYGLRHMALRYFNAAGADPDGEIGEARDVETHLVPLALDALLGKRPPLRILGDDYPTPDGTAIRDYIHVSDLADAHVRALDLLLAGEPSCRINLGTGYGYSVRQVLDAAAEAAGRKVPHEIAPRRPGDPAELVADPRMALALLGNDLTRNSNLTRIMETAWAWHVRERRAWE
ncbi:MAG: UDP-glucose 4-epimerase GalE [Candidatus Binatia bacterium]